MVGIESRFRRTPDGAVWTSGVYHRTFWGRYLTAFDQVGVIARVTDVELVPPDWRRVDDERVWVASLSNYVGPLQMVRSYWTVAARLGEWRGRPAAIILRVPGHVAHHVDRILVKSGRPFALEVVGDPHDVFAPGGVGGLARPVLRQIAVRALRSQCVRAVAVSYVTREVLQRRYPAGPDAVTTYYSSVDLKAASYVARAVPVREHGRRLLFIGSLETLYKGPDVLLRAVSMCRRHDEPVQLRIVGDGRERPRLTRLASALGLDDAVTFVGKLPPGSAVRRELDDCDLFVLPSRTEGLPRALIEAMARSVPCIGSDIGGIPELLQRDDLVVPGDAAALARRITEVLSDPARRQAMAESNLTRSREYHQPVLAARRQQFYETVRELTRQKLGLPAEGTHAPGY